MDDERKNELLDFCQEHLCGYRFRNLGLLDQALTTKGCGEETDCGDNQTLEFYGDEVYDFFVSRRFSSWHSVIQDDDNQPFGSDWGQEELTDEKIKLVKNKYLAERGKDLGLGDLICGSKNEIDHDIVYGEKALREAMEAIVGAVAMDIGLFPSKGGNAYYGRNSDDMLKKMDDIVESMLDIGGYYKNEDISNLEIYMRKAREWCQKAYGEDPAVEVQQNNTFLMSLYGQEPKKYTVTVTIPDYEPFSRIGNDKDYCLYDAFYDAFTAIVRNGTDYVDGKYGISDDDVDEKPLFLLKNNMSKYFGKANAPIQDKAKESRDEDGFWHVEIDFEKTNNKFKGAGETKSVAYNVAARKAVQYFRKRPWLDQSEEDPSIFDFDDDDEEDGE